MRFISTIRILAFCFILFTPLVFAASACNSSISQLVPAVVGDNGGIVNVSLRLVPGSGQAYIGILPRIAISTQDSLEQAVNYAYSISNKSHDCDILVSFNSSSEATFIEGPSAGAAMTLASYALLNDLLPRTDVIITGTIDENGDIGQVGGLLEKARGAADFGAHYFIIPAGNLYETLLLKSIEKEKNITIVQATKIDEVVDFMLYNKTIQPKELAKNRSFPNITRADDSDLSSFKPVARRMIDLENEVILSIPEGDEQVASVKNYFSNEVARSTNLLENGYPFSAANDAFLNFIDLSTIKVILSSNPDLESKKTDIKTCLLRLRRPELTSDNLDWVIGFDLRRAWASDKLNQTNITPHALAEEKYVKYNELMYAQGWCEVAKALSNNSPASGTKIEENAWKSFAAQAIDEADSKFVTDPDLVSRLSIAKTSYADGHYGAAIFDALYVYQMDEASVDLVNATQEDIEAKVTALLKENRHTLWGRLYQGQGSYLSQQGDLNSAYRILTVAKVLDDTSVSMKSMISTDSTRTPPTSSGDIGGEGAGQSPQSTFYPSLSSLMPYGAFILATIIFIICVLAVLLYFRGRGNQYGSNLSRGRKTYRTEQKKS